MTRIGLLAAAAMAMAASAESSTAPVRGKPRRSPPPMRYRETYTPPPARTLPPDAERLAAAIAKRERKAQKRLTALDKARKGD